MSRVLCKWGGFIKDFVINGEFITLAQFLKEESIISSGGQAKWYLNENPVMLNGVLENRRGKKIHPGDQIVINKNLYNFKLLYTTTTFHPFG